MRILICGGDGYLGWPAAMYFSRRKHQVAVLDNLSKRKWELELNALPMTAVASLTDRTRVWREITGQNIQVMIGDLCDYRFTENAVAKFEPEAIVHLGEQPSAPFSMLDPEHAVLTQMNNVVGTLNLLWILAKTVPDSHLIKLGTMGEYGTPNIDIEEGVLEVEHRGRRDLLPFPCQPGSFYHLSKVHSSHNIRFACNAWQLRATDLNQGIVYGFQTEETEYDSRLETSFHYDEFFGTVLNRLCVQAVCGVPLSVYGTGRQKRSFLNIQDTMSCIELAIVNPPDRGEYRVFNQFTEVFSVLKLAELVKNAASALGIEAAIDLIDNPRIEAENHYYNPVNRRLIDLGLKPHYLSESFIQNMLVRIQKNRGLICVGAVKPRVQWRQSVAKTVSPALH